MGAASMETFVKNHRIKVLDMTSGAQRAGIDHATH